ncbi:MAG TPA: hypothetical protein VF791_00715 [Pyrinomonadaceae bacterium]
MRKQFLRIALPALLLLVFVPNVSAQDDERPEFKMACEQVLKLGLDKFMEAYGEQTQDYSNAGQKEAFQYYVNCKKPANDALAAKTLSEAKRKQVDAVREEFNKFGTALWGLTYLEAGGGTMWGLISVGAYAEREDFMEKLIKAMAAPNRKSPAARRRTSASLTRIQRWLSANERKPFTENSEPEDVAQSKVNYRETMKETQDALAHLRDLLRDLPDTAAERLASAMESEAKNALADTH